MLESQACFVGAILDVDGPPLTPWLTDLTSCRHPERGRTHPLILHIARPYSYGCHVLYYFLLQWVFVRSRSSVFDAVVVKASSLRFVYSKSLLVLLSLSEGLCLPSFITKSICYIILRRELFSNNLEATSLDLLLTATQNCLCYGLLFQISAIYIYL